MHNKVVARSYYKHACCYSYMIIIYLFVGQHMAYFWVQERAMESYLEVSVLYIWAISGTRGSSGFGSVSNEHIESSTYIHHSAPTHDHVHVHGKQTTNNTS